MVRFVAKHLLNFFSFNSTFYTLSVVLFNETKVSYSNMHIESKKAPKEEWILKKDGN